jgi:hypothetical protein
MVTFTLPYELRAMVWSFQQQVYAMLFACAVSTLKGEAFLWLVLRVLIEPKPLRSIPVFQCPRCKAVMEITAFRRPVWLSG